MEPKPATIEITRPDGQLHEIVLLTKERMTIGRYPAPYNDIGLLTSELFVSRENHCTLEKINAAHWNLVPCGKNPTFLSSKGGFYQVLERTMLTHGDRIRIQGGRPGNPRDKLTWWILEFQDIERTRTNYPAPYLEYDQNTPGVISRVVNGEQRTIHLTPREQRLISYFFEWNRTHSNPPPFIPAHDLKQAIWNGPTETISSNMLQRLVEDLRKKLELEPGSPRFLVNKPWHGYRLITHLMPVIEEELPACDKMRA